MLEITLVMIVMLSAVTSVVLIQDPPPSPFAASEARLERRTWEMLHIAADHELPTTRCGGQNELEQLMVDGMRGNSSDWENWTSQFFGPEIQRSLFLHNGIDYMPLHNPSTFRGVAETYWLDANRSYSVVVPAVTTMSGLEDLRLAAPAVRDGRLLGILGEAIEISLTPHDIAGFATERTTTAATAVLYDSEATSATQYSQNLTWASPTGVPALASELQELQATGQQSVQQFLRVSSKPERDGSPGGLQSGIGIEISLPAGWHSFALDAAGWEDTEGADESHRLLRTTQHSAAELLRITATPSGDTTRPFEVIRARLLAPSHGESTLIVKYPENLVTQRDLPRHLYPTVPYPVRGDTYATFGVAFANGGPEVEVTHVNFTIPGGYDLDHHDGAGSPMFADAAPIFVDTRWATAGSENGTWERVSARQWNWTGSRTVPALGAEYWVVGLKIAPSSVAATAIEPPSSLEPEAQLTFHNGFETSGSDWGDVPGVIELTIPPSSLLGDDGYPTYLQIPDIEGLVVDERRGVSLDGSYRMLPTATDVTNVHSAVSNSSLRATSRLVPAGSVVDLRARLDSLASTLAALGVANANVDVELYSPLTRSCPVNTLRTTLDSLPTPSVLDLLLWDAGSATESVFAALADGKVYRIATDGATQQGLTLFTYDTLADGAILEKGTSAGLPTLFIGTTKGVVAAIDPATGIERWRKTIDASTAPITVLQHNASSQTLLIGREDGTLVSMETADGDVLRNARVTDHVRQVQPRADGKIYVASSNELVLLDPAFGELADYPRESILGFAAGKNDVFVASPETYVVLDRDTLALRDTRVYGAYASSNAVLAASADLEQDGAYDLVIARADSSLFVIDGSQYASYQSYWSESTVPIHDDYRISEAPDLNCNPDEFPGRYLTSLNCGLSAAAGSGPVALDVSEHGVLMSYIGEDGARLLIGQYSGSDFGTYSVAVETGTPLRTFALGDWSGDAYTFGTDTGIVAVYPVDGEDAIVTAEPSAAIGEAAFRFHIPRGGSLGTHIVRLEVSWDDAGKEQAANLYDWFEVVGPDGKPVANPTYKLVLAVEDGTLPHEDLPTPWSIPAD